MIRDQTLSFLFCSSPNPCFSLITPKSPQQILIPLPIPHHKVYVSNFRQMTSSCAQLQSHKHLATEWAVLSVSKLTLLEVAFDFTTMRTNLNCFGMQISVFAFLKACTISQEHNLWYLKLAIFAHLPKNLKNIYMRILKLCSHRSIV